MPTKKAIPTRSQWRLIAGEAMVNERTTDRVRKGLPVKMVTLERLRKAAAALGLDVEIDGVVEA